MVVKGQFSVFLLWFCGCIPGKFSMYENMPTIDKNGVSR